MGQFLVRLRQDPNPWMAKEFVEYRLDAIGRAIIEEDQLEVWVCLSKNAVNGIPQHGSLIVDGQNDADERHAAGRTGLEGCRQTVKHVLQGCTPGLRQVVETFPEANQSGGPAALFG